MNVDYWFFVGKTLLGFDSAEVWRMTLRQLYGLFEQYCIFNGLKKQEAAESAGDD